MFAERLKELRCEEDLNQAQLAEILGVSPSTIGMYEQGRRTPDLEVLNKIATHFQVSVDYLLGRTDIKNFEDFPEEVQRLTELFLKADKKKIKALEELLRVSLEK